MTFGFTMPKNVHCVVELEKKSPTSTVITAPAHRKDLIKTLMMVKNAT